MENETEETETTEITEAEAVAGTVFSAAAEVPPVHSAVDDALPSSSVPAASAPAVSERMVADLLMSDAGIFREVIESLKECVRAEKWSGGRDGAWVPDVHARLAVAEFLFDRVLGKPVERSMSLTVSENRKTMTEGGSIVEIAKKSRAVREVLSRALSAADEAAEQSPE